MSLLDRYVARQYLVNIVVLFAILFSFVVAIDAAINLGRFSENAVKLVGDREAEALGLERRRADFELGPIETAWVTVAAIFDLWWPRLLQLYNYLLGVVLVMAMGFTCSRLVRHREFLAMLSAGQSLQRVSRPIVIVALAMTGLQAINQELVIPRIAPLILREHGEAGKDRAEVERLLPTPDGSGHLFMAERFDSRSNRLEGLYVALRDDRGNVTGEIAASAAWWDGSGWVLEDGRTRPLLGTGAGEPIDAITTSLNPDEIKLRLYRGYQQSLSLGQLAQMLSQEELLTADDRQRLERIGFGRISGMIASVLALLIAMPFFVTREPRPMILQALKCAPISAVTLAGGVIGSSAAIPGLPPIVSSFVPVLVLLPLTAATLSSVRT